MEYPSNPFTWGTQKYRMYEDLKAGSCTNLRWSSSGFLKYGGRISEIRKALAPCGWMVTVKRAPKLRRVCEYTLVRKVV